jgi:hypothetical protein
MSKVLGYVVSTSLVYLLFSAMCWSNPMSLPLNGPTLVSEMSSTWYESNKSVDGSRMMRETHLKSHISGKSLTWENMRE